MYGNGVKMTFEIADDVGERFKAVVPKAKRSPVVTELIAARLSGLEGDLAAACRKANALNLDLADWEKLNETEAW